LAALRTASRSEAFRAQPAEGGLLARDERGTPSWALGARLRSAFFG